jgi:hypothetical protein
VQQRATSDRRRFPRGGRRAGDREGYSPLVMVVEPDATRRDVTEAVLAGCRFAVAPVASVEGALALVQGLAPAVIICADGDVARLREGLTPLRIPIVATSGAEEDLVERVRLAVHAGWHAL